VGVLSWLILGTLRTYGLEREGPWRPEVESSLSSFAIMAVAYGGLAWVLRRWPTARHQRVRAGAE
jgi:hypothetical protein